MRAFTLLLLAGLLCCALAREVRGGGGKKGGPPRKVQVGVPQPNGGRKAGRNSPQKEAVPKGPSVKAEGKKSQLKVGGARKGNTELKRKGKGGKRTQKRKPIQEPKAKKKNTLLQIRKQKQKQKDEESEISRQGASPYTWESCSTTTLNNTCLENALTVLEFEKNQVQNFFKQKERAASHSKISGNKNAKNSEFFEAAGYVLTALGGNITDPKCGSSNETRNTRALKDSMDTYEYLMNCTKSIDEACTIPNTTYSPENVTFLESCAETYQTLKDISADCRTNDTFKENAQLACACWAGAKAEVDTAKKIGCKASSTFAKNVKKQKGLCIKAFGKCKKAEDEAIALIHVCMSGDIISETEAAKGEVGSKY